jgi:hypothetical protein
MVDQSSQPRCYGKSTTPEGKTRIYKSECDPIRSIMKRCFSRVGGGIGFEDLKRDCRISATAPSSREPLRLHDHGLVTTRLDSFLLSHPLGLSLVSMLHRKALAQLRFLSRTSEFHIEESSVPYSVWVKNDPTVDGSNLNPHESCISLLNSIYTYSEYNTDYMQYKQVLDVLRVQ